MKTQRKAVIGTDILCFRGCSNEKKKNHKLSYFYINFTLSGGKVEEVSIFFLLSLTSRLLIIKKCKNLKNILAKRRTRIENDEISFSILELQSDSR